MPIDYDKSRELLETKFALAEVALLQRTPPQIDETISTECDRVFASRTQAYREVLLGCTVARLEDSSINIHLPYVDLGPNAFSGRSLDEKVINPFLQSKRVPCSRGPYLSVFRRSVKFDKSTRSGLRDKESYALLTVLDYLENMNESITPVFLQYQLYKFAEIREATKIPLSRLQRISLEQYNKLLSSLLATPSGGLLPVLLSVAMFTTIKTFFKLDWQVEWQGINVADAASRAGGDITILSGEKVLLANRGYRENC